MSGINRSEPTEPPPDPDKPYLWTGDRWVLVITDTSDGVPAKLNLDPPAQKAK